MKKVEIKAEDCIGCEACVNEADGVFEMKDGTAVVKPDADLSKVDEITNAVDACPSEAITATDVPQENKE